DAPAALGADVYVIHLQLVRPKPAAACFRRKSAPANDLGGEVGDRLSSEPPQGGGLHVVYDLVQDGEDVSTHQALLVGRAAVELHRGVLLDGPVDVGEGYAGGGAGEARSSALAEGYADEAGIAEPPEQASKEGRVRVDAARELDGGHRAVVCVDRERRQHVGREREVGV